MVTNNCFNYSTGAINTYFTGTGVGNIPTFQPGTSSRAGASSFLAYPSTDYTWTAADPTTFKLPFDTSVYDVASDYDASSSVYTVPTTGKIYSIQSTILFRFLSGANNALRDMSLVIYLNGSPVSLAGVCATKPSTSDISASISWSQILNAGDTIEIYVIQGTIVASGGVIRSGTPLLTWFSVNQMS